MKEGDFVICKSERGLHTRYNDCAVGRVYKLIEVLDEHSVYATRLWLEDPELGHRIVVNKGDFVVCEGPTQGRKR